MICRLYGEATVGHVTVCPACIKAHRMRQCPRCRRIRKPAEFRGAHGGPVNSCQVCRGIEIKRYHANRAREAASGAAVEVL